MIRIDVWSNLYFGNRIHCFVLTHHPLLYSSIRYQIQLLDHLLIVQHLIYWQKHIYATNSPIHSFTYSVARLVRHPPAYPPSHQLNHSLIFNHTFALANSIIYFHNRSLAHQLNWPLSHQHHRPPTFNHLVTFANSLTYSLSSSVAHQLPYTLSYHFINSATMLHTHTRSLTRLTHKFTHSFSHPTHPLHRLPTNSMACPAPHTGTRSVIYSLKHSPTLEHYSLTSWLADLTNRGEFLELPQLHRNKSPTVPNAHPPYLPDRFNRNLLMLSSSTGNWRQDGCIFMLQRRFTCCNWPAPFKCRKTERDYWS